MKIITASIVLYKTPQIQIESVMKSIIDSAIISKLYVIDNAPSEDNKSLFRKYDFVEYVPHVNTGYGSSHNIALKKAIATNSDYHVVLNPDITFGDSVLSTLSDYMTDNNDVVYILPKVLYPNGEIQYLCKLLPTPFDLLLRRFFPNTKRSIGRNDKYILKESGYDTIINPPCLSGCFMFLRVETIKLNNIFFDERYFMYLEDFDFIRNLHRIGKTIFYPYVSIVHDHSKESYKNKKMLKIHIKSTVKYFNKYGWFFDKERTLMNKQILKELTERK